MPRSQQQLPPGSAQARRPQGSRTWSGPDSHSAGQLHPQLFLRPLRDALPDPPTASPSLPRKVASIALWPAPRPDTGSPQPIIAQTWGSSGPKCRKQTAGDLHCSFIHGVPLLKPLRELPPPTLQAWHHLRKDQVCSWMTWAVPAQPHGACAIPGRGGGLPPPQASAGWCED